MSRFCWKRGFLLAEMALFSLVFQPVSLTSHTVQAPVLPVFREYAFSTGTEQTVSEAAVIDLSHIEKGYLMCRYTGDASKAIVWVSRSRSPGLYQQYLYNDGQYEVVPFLYGNGTYTVRVLEWVSDTRYRMVVGTDVEVALENELLPFLYPSKAVSVRADSLTAAKGRELTRDAVTDPERIAAIYRFVVDSIVYDHQKAASVNPGYVSDPDETLTEKKGICLDFAVLAASMLRSQGIPTKVEYGYMAGGVYHAWINVYSAESGTIDGVFEIKQGWTILDPTYGSIDRDYTAKLLSGAKTDGNYRVSRIY